MNEPAHSNASFSRRMGSIIYDGFLIVALLTTTGVAFLRHGRASRRWRECLFLVAGAMVGGGCGALFGRATFELSPLYYASASPEVPFFALTGANTNDLVGLMKQVAAFPTKR